MGKKHLTVADDFDAEITLFGGTSIQAVSLVSHSCLRAGRPKHLSWEVEFTVFVTTTFSVHALYFKAKPSAESAYNFLVSAALESKEF